MNGPRACRYCGVEGGHVVGCRLFCGRPSPNYLDRAIDAINLRHTYPLETRMPAPNPKAQRAVADGKAPLDYLEPACDDGEARVLRGGAIKYGRRNYRDTEMLWTTYLGALRRHLNALFRGEDTDLDTGEHHLYHIRANTAVLLGAMEAGTLRDDRLYMVSTALSDRVHIDGDQDAEAATPHIDASIKGLRDDSLTWSGPEPVARAHAALTAEYGRGIDDLVEELAVRGIDDLAEELAVSSPGRGACTTTATCGAVGCGGGCL